MSKLNEEKKIQVASFKNWVLGLINGIDPRMLVDMVKANEIPTLWEYELPPYLSFMKGLVQEYLPQILEQLTVESVIEYANEYRPDLARILSHDKAKVWMSRFLKKTKFMLENLDKSAYEIQILYEKKMRQLLSARENKEAQMVDNLLEENETKEDKTKMQVIEKIPTEEVERQLQKQEIESKLEGLTEDDLRMVLGDNYKKDLDFL